MWKPCCSSVHPKILETLKVIDTIIAMIKTQPDTAFPIALLQFAVVKISQQQPIPQVVR